MTAANAGSDAFTIWPKLTAPAESAKTDAECAAAVQKATGSICPTSLSVIFGGLRASGASHRKMA